MKKRLFLKLSCSLLSIVSFTFLTIPKGQVYAAKKNKPNLIFPVISDVHIGGTNADLKFRNTLQDLNCKLPNYNAIAIVGDITDNGEANNYDTFMNILNSNKNPSAASIITMGNHEYYSKNSTLAQCQNRFISKTHMPALNYDKWINGYHFIVLSPENLGKGSGVVVTDEQLNWLDGKLSENEAYNKPAFVFLHQPIPHTVYGSDTCDNVENPDELTAVLQKHPEAIYFSGHSHYLLEHPRTMFQNGFTMFNTGAIYYMMSEDDNYEPNTLAEGLVVKVYDKKVVVKCREFSQHKWVGKTFTVDYPVTFKPQDNKPPYWHSSAKAFVNNITKNSAAISYPKAKDNTLVTSYKIVNKTTGTSYKVLNSLLCTEPDYHTFDINNLAPNTNYTFDIYAVDAFNNVSRNNLTVNFTTKTAN